MSDWSLREYLRRRREFIAERSQRHPMVTATALIFAATGLAGWGWSTLLLRGGVTSMPLRYGLAFALSYPVFFASVRVWCGFVGRNRGDGGWDGGGLDSLPGGEGCFVALVVVFAAFALAGVFWAVGGFALLLEVAFEVAFAGTLVRRLGRTEIVGRWAQRLLASTWPHALVTLLVLVALAAALQRAAPQAHTFAQALRALGADRR